MLWGNTILAGEATLPTFRTVEIDAKVEIGYGVALADVDGDMKLDILLADKKQIVWYRNPTWGALGCFAGRFMPLRKRRSED